MKGFPEVAEGSELQARAPPLVYGRGFSRERRCQPRPVRTMPNERRATPAVGSVRSRKAMREATTRATPMRRTRVPRTC